MKTKTPLLNGVVVACTLCVAAGSALAQSQTAKKPGDPARWYTKQQTTTTLKKEINAAYAEQKSACNRGAKSERAGCLADARKTYQTDMKNMTQLAKNTPAGGVNERVVTTTEAGGTSGGTSAMGGSQGGSTASGGMEAGAAATGSTGSTGSSGSGITASGTAQSDAEAATSASGQPQVPQTQPMQPPPVTTPPRSEDTPIQR
nr:hypothetical protein [uncultured Massilia sp.]